MIVERFYDEKLAQASYLIGCPATGEALVVDANRDVEQYIRRAETLGLRVTHVTETHIHADYVSGSLELARRAGAGLHLSGEGGADWQYGFAAGSGARLIRDGDRIRVGNVEIEVLHTPGHTPEHLTFLVTDGAAADRPVAALTGDFVFVGDVGRPDLLERAAGLIGTMEAGARELHRSLGRFKEQPDYLQIWPGHGAGSACGKGLSAIPTSTVGYERRFNWAFQIADEDGFVEAVLAGQPEAPRYFAEMKRINRDGPRLLGGFRRPERRTAVGMAEVLATGGLVVDTRPAPAFAAGHIPGTINIPLDNSFTTWSGWLVPYDRDFHLLTDDRCRDCIDEAVRDLAMIGLDRVAGYFGTEAVEAWAEGGGELQVVRQVDADELEVGLAEGGWEAFDVRGATEWAAGHLPNVANLPLGLLPDHQDRIPTDRPLVVHCQGGGRASIAASLLQAWGFRNVASLAGGFAAWTARGKPVVTGALQEASTAS